jgi:hypothetical protein
MRRPLVAVLSIALVSLAATACGSDDEASSGTGPDSEFCVAAKAADEAGTAVDRALDGGDPAELKPAFADALAKGKAAQKLAPDDIADTVADVVKGQEQLIALFEKDDYDLTKILANPDFQTLIDDERFSTASDKLDTYLADVCGIARDDTNSGSVPAGTIDLGNGDPEAALDQFISLYEIGSGTKLTDEQRTCLKDTLRDALSSDDLSSIVGGTPDDAVTTALGNAFISCKVTP